jgi:predicted MFS family arabinose efflux permease
VSSEGERPVLSPRLVLVMALACGVGVANAYFPQAITPLLAADLHVSGSAATSVATMAQVGYALGIFFLVPLGDRLSRRPLVAGLFGLVAIGLFLSGTLSSLPLLYTFSAVVGAATVVPQVLIPMAADLADKKNAASVVGMLQGGLLGGILLARAFGGTLGEWLGWRAPYLVAGVLAVLLAAILVLALPKTKSASQHTYPALLGTSLRLFATLPDLRRSCFYQGLLFGGFTAAWTSIALLITGPSYGYGTSVVGLVALVGAGSVFMVPAAGRWIDRRGSDIVNLVCIIGVVLAAALLLTGLLGGIAGLIGLIVGMLLLDVSVQSSQVANQARIFALVPGARSRLNSAYMTCVFVGGSVGSWVGARIFVGLGWGAVCGLLAAAAVIALIRHLLYKAPAPQPAAEESLTPVAQEVK